MGKAIAAFRKYALRARESLDWWRFQADCDTTGPNGEADWPDSPFAGWVRDLLCVVGGMKESRLLPAEYVSTLHTLQQKYELNFPAKPRPAPAPGTMSYREQFYFERRNGRAALRGLSEEAIREAVAWGPLAERVEGYSRRLFNATEKMVHAIYVSQNTSDYVALLEEWFDAFDGLSPFEGNPADKSSEAAAKKAEREFPARPVGMPKVNDEALERELVTGWDALGERCRRDGERLPSKEQYIEDRNRGVLKDPKRLAALNAEHFRYLETGLRARRRKRQGTRTKRR